MQRMPKLFSFKTLNKTTMNTEEIKSMTNRIISNMSGKRIGSVNKTVGSSIGKKVKSSKRDATTAHYNKEYTISDRTYERGAIIPKNGYVKDKSALKLKTNKSTSDDDQAMVNPFYDYPKISLGLRSFKKGNYEAYEFRNNCASCSLAYELRRRGYDVEAGPITSTAPDVHMMGNMYGLSDASFLSNGKGVHKVTDINSDNEKRKAREIEQTILNTYGNGTRGQFVLQWRLMGGHSVVWECNDNKVIIRDCQSNETYTVLDEIEKAETCDFFRTDDIDIDNIKLNSDQFYVINRED